MSDRKQLVKALAGKSILMIDDEDIVLEAIGEAISPTASVFDTANNGYDALACIMKRDYDFILLDIEMPRMNGMNFYNSLSEIKPYLNERVIFITGDTETQKTRRFIESTGCRYIDKPFMIRDLLRVMVSLDDVA